MGVHEKTRWAVRHAGLLVCMSAIAICSAGRCDVDLNGTWELAWFVQPDEGAVRTPAAVPHDATRVKATVPGNCLYELVRAGYLPDPEKGLNVLAFREYEDRQWFYTREFTAPALAKGEKAVLVFDGVDTLSDIFLNGVKIGETDNMLIPHSFDVTGRLVKGVNRVQVLIRSVAIEAQEKSVDVLGYAIGDASTADLQLFRKAAHMGGWDIAPRLLTAGLWRGVRLEVKSPVRVDQVNWIVSGIDPAIETGAGVRARFRLQAPFRTMRAAKVRCRLAKNGKTVAECVRMLKGYHTDVDLGYVKSLERWWPRGMGDRPLYDAEIAIVGGDGAVLATDICRIGIRTITLERDDIYGPDRPGRFLFRINGEPLYVRGSNWVPMDALHGRGKVRMGECLELFKDLNCNMIRVWGGGVYETEEFFDRCDEEGLLVWQDFMTGCSVFPQDDGYAAATRREAVSVVRRLRNHASLAVWCGNNENDYAFAWMKPREFAADPNHDRNSRVTLARAVLEYDMTRPYLPSSPYYSPDVHAGLAKPAEQHLWGRREYYKVPFYTNAPCWFASEMGYHGCPNRASLERMMTRPCVYPWKKVTGTDPFTDYHWNDEWLLKASNPFLDRDHVNYMRRNSLMPNQTKIMFGFVPTDLDDFIFASQTVQAEAMKTFIEKFRSEKFRTKTGLIWWNMRDCWPQISDAVVDFYGGKKRAYFAIRTAQRDQLVLVRDDRRVVAVNDTRRPVRGSVRITDRDSGKLVFEKSYSVPANGVTDVGTVEWSGQGVLDIVYEQGGESHSNWFLYGEPPFDLGKMKIWMNQRGTDV